MGCDLDKGPETTVEEEADHYWIGYCRKCKVLMAWSKEHTMPVDDRTRSIFGLMAIALIRVASRVYGPGNYHLDHEQRDIVDHMHIHARPIQARTSTGEQV